MPRIALGLEYDGAAFAGWQSQAHARGVQESVEQALAKVANHPVEVLAAGRTDAGVHALMQVIHFDSDSARSERGWVLGANTYLPPQVSALWARPVPDAFHARYSAFARRYRYVILNRTPRPALAAARVCWIRDPLDADRMHSAGQLLIGEQFDQLVGCRCIQLQSVRYAVVRVSDGLSIILAHFCALLRILETRPHLRRGVGSGAE